MPSDNNDDNGRRAYWTQQMEAAHGFVQEILRYPVEECGERAVPLRDAVEEAGVEVEFSQRPHVNGLPRLYLLREGLAPDFIAAAREMNERGWILRIEDAFRTRQMQKLLAVQDYTFDAILKRLVWERAGEMPSQEFIFRRLSVLVATCPKIGTHMSCSALDVSVLARDDGAEVDRGGPYLEMSERTPMSSPFVSTQAQESRREITALMRRHGFVAYPFEFWHYNKGDAFDERLNSTGRPARYGAVDIDPDTGTVTPIPDPEKRLSSPEELGIEIQRAQERIRQEH